jgi:hypothetical protein
MITIGQSIGKPDSYTKLLISGRNPANIKDLAPGKAITNTGSVAFQTTHKKLNPNALSFSGSTQYLSIAKGADFDFGTGNFTIDFWCKNTNAQAYCFIFSCKNTDLRLFTYYGNGNLYLCLFNNNWAGGIACSHSTWHHVAVVRTGNDIYLYVDGVGGKKATTASAIGDSNTAFYLSYNTDGYQGNLDEFRISKGIARWTSNFTPPKRNYHSQSV